MWLVAFLKKLVGASMFLLGLLGSHKAVMAMVTLVGHRSFYGFVMSFSVFAFCGCPCLWYGWVLMGLPRLYAKPKPEPESRSHDER